MTIRDLEIFVAVAENGGIGAAAKKLYISQPTVSHAISQIEKTYQVILFERLSKKLLITATGEEFLQYARYNLNNFRNMEQYLYHVSEQLTIHIGASLTVGGFFLADMISDFEKKQPQIRVRVYIDNTKKIVRQILNGSLDIAVLEGEIHSEEMITKTVYEDKMVLICGRNHPFADKKSIRVAELRDTDCVLREEGSGTRDFLINLTQKQGIPIVEKWVCHSSDSIINIVAAGQGVSVLSEAIVLNEPGVLQIPIEDADMTRKFRIVYHKDKFISSALEKFITGTTTYFHRVHLQKKSPLL
jgi:DNA-binding transcriptional LysR family regulator